MLKKNIALILTLNLICVIACGLQVNADDNMIWTDSFSVTNQPAAQVYESDLFSGIVKGTRPLPLMSVIKENDNAVMKFSYNSAVNDTGTGYLKTKPFDLSNGKELIFKEKFKVSKGSAVNRLALLCTSSAGANDIKEGFVSINTGSEKMYVGTVNNAPGYSTSFTPFADISKWFSYEARLKINSDGTYTVDNYVFNDNGTLFFHPNIYISSTALTAAEIANLQIRAGVSNGYSGTYELYLDDCSVIIYQGGGSTELAFSSPANQSTGVRLDSDVLMAFADLLDDTVRCTIFKDGELLDEGLYSIKKTAFSLKLIFNSDLVKNSLYKILVADAEGEKGSFSFETEKAHKIEMSLTELNRYDAETDEYVTLTKLTTGKIQAKLLINDPLKYSSFSGIITPVLYREGKMIWIGGMGFSKVLADGKAQLTAEFELPTGTDGDELKFLLFDSDLKWMPLNEGVVWMKK